MIAEFLICFKPMRILHTPHCIKQTISKHETYKQKGYTKGIAQHDLQNARGAESCSSYNNQAVSHHHHDSMIIRPLGPNHQRLVR